jgi:hypothetical protein
MRIRPEETELIGQWESIGGTIRADASATRIKDLTDAHLTKVAVAESGWETLYKDPTDLRFWELTYPHSEMHGGGPPMLRCLSAEEAPVKYDF